MYGFHYEMAKSIAEGRSEQVKKSAVQRSTLVNMLKKKRKKGVLSSFKKLI